MWSVMMVAMMLPVLVPILSRYREALARTAGTRLGQLTTLVGAGYFAVWTLCGVVVFPLGLALAEIAMRVPAVSRAMPIATGVVMLIAGILQFTAWKKRRLECCRAAPGRVLMASAGTAWRHGLQLGLRCVRCCASLTAVLLAIGVMDLRAMAGVTALIAAERLAPAGERVARGIGVVVAVCGLIQVAKATGLC
jgi:predicted metal-binding membrane protein